MSPLLFLAIPVVIFVVGSTVLCLASRFSNGTARFRNAPDDLRAVAPMLQQQRETTGWPVGSSRYPKH